MPQHASIELNTRVINFKSLGDERGQLCALEQLSSQVPFEIKRVYYMWGVGPEQVRGKHAHYKLKQILICVSGGCDIVLDDGRERKTLRLDNPLQGLLIDGIIWHEMKNFSNDCTLMVLASDYYDEKEYIRNYDDFLKEI